MDFWYLFSYKILNYKLYKHHYLSIIIISTSSLLLAIIQLYESEDKPKYIFSCLMGIIAVALYSLELTFDKYLIFSKYIKSYEILVFQGVIELILGIISLIIATKYDIIDNFWDYYNQLDKNEIIFLILLIILNSIYYSLIITIIDILSPFFIFIIFVISIMIIYIIGFRSLSFNSVIVRIVSFTNNCPSSLTPFNSTTYP